MKLEDQCVSLELAKRLKKLGVRQKSVFFWLEYNDGEKEVIYRPADGHSDMGYSAFTVAELGEMLPKGYSTYRDTPVTDLKSSVWYGEEIVTEECEWSAKKEADCRAQMLIELIEKGIVKP